MTHGTPIKAYRSFLPQFFPADWLAERRASVGEAVWNALYQGSPMPGDSQLFPPDAWTFIERLNTEAISNIVTSWDTSFGKHDLSANVVLAQMATGGYVVLDCFARKLDFNDLPNIITERFDIITKQYRCRPVLVIEDASSGSDAIVVLRKKRPDIPMIPLTAPKSKQERGLSVSHFVNGGVVALGPGDWHDDFINELACFPGGGRFDDRADAFVHAMRCFITVSDMMDFRNVYQAEHMLKPGRQRSQAERLRENLALQILGGIE